MSTRIVSASLALILALGSPSVLAWKMVDGKAVLSGGEGLYCEDLAMDAGAALIGRQKNMPPEYPRDSFSKPNSSTLKMREIFAQQVVTYPQRETAEEEWKDVRDYMNLTRSRCLQLHIEVTPPSP